MSYCIRGKSLKRWSRDLELEAWGGLLFDLGWFTLGLLFLGGSDGRLALLLTLLLLLLLLFFCCSC